MSIALVRRIVFLGLGVAVFSMAVEEFHLQGHMGAAVGSCVAGVVLLGLAATGKGG
jgi:uncharacterized membrane protein